MNTYPPAETGLCELGARELAHLMDQHRVLLVDVREPEEYQARRIPGAFLFPLSTFDVARIPEPGTIRVVFCCGTGKRSAQAAEAMLKAGWRSVAHLRGGVAAWSAEGLSVQEP
jgi:rhodanese-related sulfurtransferase